MHGAAARLWQVVAHVVDLLDASNTLARARREHLPWRGMLRCCARVLRVQAAFSACLQPWNCGGVVRIKSSEGCSRCALQSLNDLVGGGQAGGASCAWRLSFFCCELQQKDHKVTLIVRLPSRRAVWFGGGFARVLGVSTCFVFPDLAACCAECASSRESESVLLLGALQHSILHPCLFFASQWVKVTLVCCVLEPQRWLCS